MKETENKKQVLSPRTRNTENVAYKNRSDPCGRWCSKEGDGRKHQESIREKYCDGDSKDLHAGICAKVAVEWCHKRR